MNGDEENGEEGKKEDADTDSELEVEIKKAQTRELKELRKDKEKKLKALAKKSSIPVENMYNNVKKRTLNQDSLAKIC